MLGYALPQGFPSLSTYMVRKPRSVSLMLAWDAARPDTSGIFVEVRVGDGVGAAVGVGLVVAVADVFAAGVAAGPQAVSAASRTAATAAAIGYFICPHLCSNATIGCESTAA
ncbi:hypothetical protein TV39_08900 [Arthrobacter sp. SPG23]|nr:hypothetical protein TV39_08900 [Arthrobacter sp. SPG23]